MQTKIEANVIAGKMSLNVCNAYRKITPYFPAHLASKSQIKNLKAFQEILPHVFLAMHYMFETTMAKDKKWVDITFYFKWSKEQLQAFENYWQKEKIHREIKESVIWNRFFNCVLQKHAKNHIKGMWVSFDLGSSTDWPPQPNLYFGMQKNRTDPEVVKELFFLLQKRKLPLTRLQSIQKFMDQCRQMNIRLAHLGFMLARDANDVRFDLRCAEFRNPEFLEEFLAKIKYIDRMRFVDLVKKLPSCVKDISLLLDYGASVHPKMGMELHLMETDLVKSKSSWQRVIKFLVAEGVILAKKGGDVLSWIGGHREQTRLAILDGILRSESNYFFRDISHIKIVNAPGKPLEAKAYLSSLHTAEA